MTDEFSKPVDDDLPEPVNGDDRPDAVDHDVREGRNGGGDPWHTDGKLFVGLLKIEP